VYKFFAEEVHGASGGAGTLQPIPIPENEERFHTTDAEFIQAIRGGPKVSPDFAEGVRYTAFCEAVALSVKEGKEVNLSQLQSSMLSWGRRLDGQ
jgi:predicted dehydrogenase